MPIHVFNLKRARVPVIALLCGLAVLTAVLALREPETVPVMEMRGGSPTLIIDPGHGGLDGGAVGTDGALESGINLAIAEKLQTLCKLFGLKSVMTRDSEELDYPPELSTTREKKVWDQKQRLELANSTENAIFLSIHQNKYPDSRPNGTQALYAATDGSERFGTLTHENLITALNPENRRVPAPASKDIYLMKNLKIPGILVECGFLSNPTEAKKLQSDDYQIALATVLLASYLQYLNGAG